MTEKTWLSYLSVLILAVLVFISNFLDTNLFHFGDMNFAVWFILSFFCYACGHYINKVFGWQFGGKLVFAASISVTVISITVIIFFKEYFNAPNPTGENIILFALRNVFLGGMGFFGMAVAEAMAQQGQVASLTEKLQLIEETIKDSKKEADLTVKDAQIKANKIINEAELTAKNVILKKERIERELREFIQIEKELLKKYEENK
ncbi:MAG: hypothetical protein LWX56_08585 [Ignavibacteria bacterium]|nr:hypothetical protein [Ignavibacteria bacterium]